MMIRKTTLFVATLFAAGTTGMAIFLGELVSVLFLTYFVIFFTKSAAGSAGMDFSLSTYYPVFIYLVVVVGFAVGFHRDHRGLHRPDGPAGLHRPGDRDRTP